MGMLRISLFIVLASALCAQQKYSPSDVQAGDELFRGNCMNCHGADGEAVAGVDLMHGKFRHAVSDSELVGIITKGIAGTAMPPASLSDAQAQTIVVYLRSRAATGAADAAAASRGRALFETRAACLSCHRVQGKGGLTGPDLSDIGARRKPADLERSIVDPNAETLAENRTVRAVTKDGVTINGRLLSHDTFAVQLIDSKEHLVSLDKSNLRELTFLPNSPMPSYRDKLSAVELTDLVSYLVSLKGI
jgi:putative heme-binding domain-containing protein